jgi:branched-chain amino acid transport system permease protein
MERRKERIDRGIKARSSDIFALSSWREMLYLAAPRLLPIVGLIVLSFALSVYWQRVLLSVSIFRYRFLRFWQSAGKYWPKPA